MSEREAVLREFTRTVEHCEFASDDVLYAHGMADEIVRLRAQLTTAERERDEARRERDDAIIEKRLSDEQRARWMTENVALVHRAERAERVVEAARPWLADLWRGDLNGTVIGVCMEYEPDGQYALWEQVAPIAEAVRALDAHHASKGEG